MKKKRKRSRKKGIWNKKDIDKIIITRQNRIHGFDGLIFYQKFKMGKRYDTGLILTVSVLINISDNIPVIMHLRHSKSPIPFLIKTPVLIKIRKIDSLVNIIDIRCVNDGNTFSLPYICLHLAFALVRKNFTQPFLQFYLLSS